MSSAFILAFTSLTPPSGCPSPTVVLHLLFSPQVVVGRVLRLGCSTSSSFLHLSVYVFRPPPSSSVLLRPPPSSSVLLRPPPPSSSTRVFYPHLSLTSSPFLSLASAASLVRECRPSSSAYVLLSTPLLRLPPSLSHRRIQPALGTRLTPAHSCHLSIVSRMDGFALSQNRRRGCPMRYVAISSVVLRLLPCSPAPYIPCPLPSSNYIPVPSTYANPAGSPPSLFF